MEEEIISSYEKKEGRMKLRENPERCMSTYAAQNTLVWVLNSGSVQG